MAVGDTIILPWYGGATAAYTYRLDDLRASVAAVNAQLAVHDQYTAARAFAALGLRASFAAIESETWFTQQSLTKFTPEQMLEMQADGHEFMNHTRDHLPLTELAGESAWAEQLDSCYEWLTETVGIERVTSFIYPGNMFSAATQQFLRERYSPTWLSGLPGTRGWLTAVSVGDPGGDSLVTLGEANRTLFAHSLIWSPNASGGDTAMPKSAMDAHVQAAISAGGWGIAQIHDVSDNLNGNNGGDNHLEDFVLPKIAAGELWVDTMRNVANYYHQRLLTTLSVAVGQRLVRVTPATTVPVAEQPLTLRTEVPAEWASSGFVLIQQAGQEDQVVAIANGTIQYDLDPTAGPAVLVPVCSEEDAAALVSGEATSIGGVDWTMHSESGSRPTRVYTASGRTVTIPASTPRRDWQLLRDLA